MREIIIGGMWVYLTSVALVSMFDVLEQWRYEMNRRER